METNAPPNGTTQVGEISSVAVLFGRVMWMLAGPMALCLITYGIVSGGDGWFQTADAAFAIVLLFMIGGRWIEQRSGVATTVTGQPATVQHFKRYLRTFVPAAVGLWIAANVLGNHVLA